MPRRRGFETGQLCGFPYQDPGQRAQFRRTAKYENITGVPKSLFVSKCYGWAIRLRVGGASLSPHSFSPRSLALLNRRLFVTENIGVFYWRKQAGQCRLPGYELPN